MELSYDYDFSQLDTDELRNEGSSFAEIISVCENITSRWREIEGYQRKFFYCIAIGYSNQKRIIQVACCFPDEKLQILQVGRPGEEEIDQYYCGG